MNIFLIGMMGSGKSTVGRNLARQLSYSFIDTDSLIEKNQSLNIPEIFAKYGEDRFRELEKETLNFILESDHQVIATGGGLPCYHNNIILMKENGICIYFQAASKKRINNDGLL
jgi:shikimate kinase